MTLLVVAITLILPVLKKGEKVLDLGCGSGRDCIAAAKIVGSTGKVTGLDLTPEMVIKARARIAEEKVDNVNFINGTIEALPLHDQSFDVVLSNCVINHSRDKTKVYREIWRVLKPGGAFCGVRCCFQRTSAPRG